MRRSWRTFGFLSLDSPQGSSCGWNQPSFHSRTAWSDTWKACIREPVGFRIQVKGLHLGCTGPTSPTCHPVLSHWDMAHTLAST